MLLTLITFIPLIAAFVVLALPSEQKSLIKWFSLGSAILVFLLCSKLMLDYRSSGEETVLEKFDAKVAERLQDLQEPVRGQVRQALSKIEQDNGKTQDLLVSDRGPSGYASLVAGFDLSKVTAKEADIYHECWELTTAKGRADAKERLARSIVARYPGEVLGFYFTDFVMQ